MQIGFERWVNNRMKKSDIMQFICIKYYNINLLDMEYFHNFAP